MDKSNIFIVTSYKDGRAEVIEQVKREHKKSKTSEAPERNEGEAGENVTDKAEVVRCTMYDDRRNVFRRMQGYRKRLNNHCGVLVETGYVYHAVFTLRSALDDIYEMPPICKRFESFARRCKLFNGSNFKFARFIELPLECGERGIIQPHVHYLLFGDKPLSESNAVMEDMLTDKWEHLDPRNGYINNYKIIKSFCQLSATINYLTDYRSGKPKAIEKRESLKYIPCNVSLFSLSRNIELPKKITLDYNPYGSRKPDYWQDSSHNSFYQTYYEYGANAQNEVKSEYLS